MIKLSPLEVRFSSSFAVSLRGQPTPDTSGVVQAVSRALTARFARNVIVSKDRLSFEGPGIFAVANWRLLAPVDGGELTLASDAATLHVRYTLRYTRSAVLQVVAALLPATIIGLAAGLLMGLAALVFFELVVCFANLQFSLGRMRDFFEVTVHKAVREAGRGRLTSA
jgi:hypothetical protein